MRLGSLQRVEQGRNGVRAMAVNIRYFSCAQQFTGTREDFLLAPLDVAAGRVRGETGVPGLKLDFCCGLRLEVPTAGWRVRISDAETGLVFYDEVSEQAQRIVSLEKYYMPWSKCMMKIRFFTAIALVQPGARSILFAIRL